jgi:hypothetical protein
MNEPNILLNNKLSAGQKVSKLANDHQVIIALAVGAVIFGLVVLFTKTRSSSESNCGRYTEFDTNY